MTATEFTTLIQRAERVLAQLEAWLPPAPPDIDWNAHAFRWRKDVYKRQASSTSKMSMTDLMLLVFRYSSSSSRFSGAALLSLSLIHI